MSATKKLDVSFNISTSVNESNVDLETGEIDYCVAEFYEIFKDRLPCLVVVHHGFCSPLTEDTFDKDQMLLLKTTSSQKRVLGKIVGVELSQKTNLISLPVNYKEKLFIFKNGKATKKTTLDVILKENLLPCKVAFADSREVIASDRTVSTRGITTIELTELFDEVYFLGNCVNYSQLALNVVQVPFYLSSLTFKIVKGFKDNSRSFFSEYIEKLLQVSSFLNYNIPCGNMKIAKYDPTAVHAKAKLSLLQPNIYTSYVTLTKRPTTESHTKVDDPKPPQGTSGSKTTTKQKNSKTAGATDTSSKLIMSRTASLEMTLPRDRPLPPLPRGSTPPPKLPDRKPKSEPFTVLAETFGPKIHDVQSVAKINKPEAQTVSKRYGQEIHNVAKGNGSNDKNPLEQKPDHDKAPKRDEKRVATVKVLPILATQKQEIRQFDDGSPEYATEQRGKPPIDVKTLSIHDVCECLTHLNLHEYRKVFRDNMVNGDTLMDIDRDILCTYFGMSRIEALRLVKFAATGKIPT
ncbi:hypothetical protein ACF0H5_022822 [Mactra antiquata]